MLPKCGLADATGLAERLRHTVAAEPVATAAGSINLTLSLGVTASEPGQQTASDVLLRRADSALYQAKRLGRDQVAIWQGD